jgi:hypothetical protein
MSAAKGVWRADSENGTDAPIEDFGGQLGGQ